MCVCDPNIRTPYCGSFECQQALKKAKKAKINKETPMPTVKPPKKPGDAR